MVIPHIMKTAGLEALHSLLICSANKGFASVQETHPTECVRSFAGHEGHKGCMTQSPCFGELTV